MAGTESKFTWKILRILQGNNLNENTYATVIQLILNKRLLGNFYYSYYQKLILQREQFCDCFIWSQEKCFRAHRIILAACSGFFRRIFLKTDTESSPTNVVLNDSVSPTDVSQILDVIYKGVVDAHREVSA